MQARILPCIQNIWKHVAPAFELHAFGWQNKQWNRLTPQATLSCVHGLTSESAAPAALAMQVLQQRIANLPI